jgi:hypothetical protein
MTARRSGIDRFWTRVNVNPNGCWEWVGYRDPLGYGRYSFGRRRALAHRVLWQWMFGPLDGPSQVVMHACDNPPCVNPLHLSVGTMGDNIRDAAAKKRLHGPTEQCRRGHPWVEPHLAHDHRGNRYCRTCRADTRRRRYEEYGR